MAHAFLRRCLLASDVLVVLALAAACAPAPTPAAQPAAGTSAPADKVEVALELGPGDFDLPDPAVGLAELSSYEATLMMSFDGKEGGQPAKWSRTYDLQFSKDPAARFWTMQTAEDLTPDQVVGRLELNGAAYEISADGSCAAHALDPASSSAAELEPAASLVGLLGAQAAGHETLEGVEADHYTFDERALAQAGRNKSTGEVWVAAQGGYVLRYLKTTTAGADYFGEGTEGKLELEYDLTGINKPLTIELPPGCPPGLVQAPMMPDAANVHNEPGVLQYESAASVPDVAAFYAKQLPAQGWVDPSTVNVPDGISPQDYQQLMQQMQALGMTQPTAVPSETEAMLVFDQGAQRLSVSITRTESVTRVSLSLDKAPGK
jgi:hypothetical protein